MLKHGNLNTGVYIIIFVQFSIFYAMEFEIKLDKKFQSRYLTVYCATCQQKVTVAYKLVKALAPRSLIPPVYNVLGAIPSIL